MPGQCQCGSHLLTITGRSITAVLSFLTRRAKLPRDETLDVPLRSNSNERTKAYLLVQQFRLPYLRAPSMCRKSRGRTCSEFYAMQNVRLS